MKKFIAGSAALLGVIAMPAHAQSVGKIINSVLGTRYSNAYQPAYGYQRSYNYGYQPAYGYQPSYGYQQTYGYQPAYGYQPSYNGAYGYSYPSYASNGAYY